MQKDEILKLRHDKQLHSVVENRLKMIFDAVSPGSFTIKELAGKVTTGRPDTVTFTAKGKMIHVEIIASKDMVFRDLNNMNNSSADLCVTILMDEKYDPLVADAYFRAAENKYKVIRISDVLEPVREEWIRATLHEVLLGLERVGENIDAKIKERFEIFIKGLKINGADRRSFHVGIFPRRYLSTWGKEAEEKNLFDKFEPFGLTSAADPLGFVAGIGWRFSHDGQYFSVTEPPGGGRFYTQIAVGDYGDVIFSLVEELNHNEDIFGSGISKVFEPALAFASQLYKGFKYDGMIDVLIKIQGVMSKNWFRIQDPNDMLTSNLRRRVFTSNELFTPRMTFTAEELGDYEKRKEIYNDLFIFLQRITVPGPRG